MLSAFVQKNLAAGHKKQHVRAIYCSHYLLCRSAPEISTVYRSQSPSQPQPWWFWVSPLHSPLLANCVQGLPFVWTLSQYVCLASRVGSHWHDLYSCQPAGDSILSFSHLGYIWWLADDSFHSFVPRSPNSLCSEISNRIKYCSSWCHALIQPAQHLWRFHFKLNPKLCIISSISKCALP